MQNIAILPFVNPLNDSKQDYLCAALAIELTHLLSNHRDLKVVSTASTFAVTESSSSKNLNVDLFLKGSLISSGERIRVTAQIIRSKDQYCLQSIKFEESKKALFELVDKISVQIVEYLKLETVIKTTVDIDAEAYKSYLKGLYFWNLWSEENIRTAIDHFTRTVNISPEFAMGYARLSNCWSMLAAIQIGDIYENYDNAKKAALKAISLDNNMPEAHISLALIRLLNDVDILGAFHSIKKALSLNYQSPEARYYYSFYLMIIGKYKEAIQNVEYALKYDPLNVQMNSTYGFALSLFGDFNAAEDQLKYTLNLAPDSKASYDALFWNYFMSEQYDQARLILEHHESSIMHTPASQVVLYHKIGLDSEVEKWMKKLSDENPTSDNHSSVREASIVYLTLGDIKKGSLYFDKFYEEKIGFVMVLTHPAWKDFRESPRFYKYKKRLKLLNPPNISVEQLEDAHEIIVLNSNTADELSIKLKDLLFIESQNIYSKVVWSHEGRSKEKLLRVPLSKIIDQSINPNLFRCHKSYAINRIRQYTIVGNRKTMKLIPVGFNFQVPVSRTKASDIYNNVTIVEADNQ